MWKSFEIFDISFIEELDILSDLNSHPFILRFYTERIDGDPDLDILKDIVPENIFKNYSEELEGFLIPLSLFKDKKELIKFPNDSGFEEEFPF